MSVDDGKPAGSAPAPTEAASARPGESAPPSAAAAGANGVVSAPAAARPTGETPAESGAGGTEVPEAGSTAEGLKMVLTMTIFTLVAAGLLGFVYAKAKPRIDAAKREEKGQAFSWILPAFDNKPLDTWSCIEPPGAPPGDACRKALYTATQGGAVVGYAVEAFTTAGFGPRIDVLVGGTPDGTVTGVYVLGHQETPGLGAKIVDGMTAWKDPGSVSPRPFILQFAGKKLGGFDFRVAKDGGQVDAITASTITSRAVAAAIEDALRSIVGASGVRVDGVTEASGGSSWPEPAVEQGGAR